MSDIRNPLDKNNIYLNKRDRSRKQKNIKNINIFIIIGLIIISLSYYFINVNKYKNTFFPNTYINGLNVSNKKVEDVTSIINEQIRDYKLRIKSRTATEEIIGTDIGLGFNVNNTLSSILKSQNPYMFIKYLFVAREIKIDEIATFNKDLLNKKMDELVIFDPNTFTKHEPAKFSEYTAGVGYSVIPAKLGTEINVENAKKQIEQAVYNLKYEIDLSDDSLALYIDYNSLNEEIILNEKLADLNKIISSEITYSKIGVLNGDTIHTWVLIDEYNNISIDDQKLEDFVGEVAKSYNTVSLPKSLKTAYGSVVNVRAGDYGWKVDEEKEKTALKELILAGSVINREPEFSRKAASYGQNDYGDTYIEVNLTAQKLFFYKNGKLILESEFVSGNEKSNWSTPTGAYSIKYKEKNAILNGENYSTPVSYWIPFNGNIGFHDAKWRSSFGGDIYKNSGSHGCINMPPDKAKVLFENTEVGTPVLCYKLDGTNSNVSSSNGTDKTTSTKANDTTKKSNSQNKQTNNTASTKATTEETLEKIPTSPIRVPKGPGVSTRESKGPAYSTTEQKGPGFSIKEEQNIDKNTETSAMGPASKIKNSEASSE